MATVFADTYGFNATDATAALQTALNDPVADRVLVRNMGTPWQIKSTISLRSSKEVVFEPGVVVQAIGPKFTNEDNSLFNAVNIQDFQLTGLGTGAQQATLKMDRPTAPGENAHLVSLRGVKNYRVSGLKLSGAGDDGLYIAGADFRKFPGVLSYSENGLIENVVADNNRRQGLSIISAKDLIVRNSKFINTNGIDPGAGIDIEPNEPVERLQNIKIENVDLSNNRGNGLDLSLTNQDNSSLPISIDVNGARIDGNRKSGIDLSWFSKNSNVASATPNGVITVRNTVISNTLGDVPLTSGGSAGILVRALSGDRSDPNNLRLNFDNVTITDTANNQPAVSNPIRVRGFGGATDTQQVGNLSFKDVVVRDNFKRDIFKADLGRNDGYLNNVSGNITAYNPNGVTAEFDTRTPPQNFSLTVQDGKPSAAAAVTNPSFRDGFTGWAKWNEQVSLVDRPGEDKWVKVVAAGGGLGQDVTDDLVAGQNYVVSAVARLSQTGDQGTVGVLFKDAAGKIVDTKSFSVTANTTQPSSVSFTAPNSFKVAQIFAWKSAGNADLFVDDFSLLPQA
jgi:hypothetical protein